MPLPVDDYARDVEAILGDIGAQVLLRRLTTVDQDTLYNEKKGKTYSTPGISLLAYPRFSPEPEHVSPVGKAKDVSATFLFPTTVLEAAGLIDDPITDNDIIEHDNRIFDIVNVVGVGFLAGKYLAYRVETVERI